MFGSEGSLLLPRAPRASASGPQNASVPVSNVIVTTMVTMDQCEQRPRKQEGASFSGASPTKMVLEGNLGVL